MVVYSLILLKIRNILDKAVAKIKTQILSSVTFFEKLAVHEIMWTTRQVTDENIAHALCMLDN